MSRHTSLREQFKFSESTVVRQLINSSQLFPQLLFTIKKPTTHHQKKNPKPTKHLTNQQNQTKPKKPKQINKKTKNPRGK